MILMTKMMFKLLLVTLKLFLSASKFCKLPIVLVQSTGI